MGNFNRIPKKKNSHIFKSTKILTAKIRDKVPFFKKKKIGVNKNLPIWVTKLN